MKGLIEAAQKKAQERTLTAKAKAPTSRAEATAAFEAACLEIFNRKVEGQRPHLKRWSAALKRGKWYMYAIAVRPNRFEIDVETIDGKVVTLNLGLVSGMRMKHTYYRISELYPEIRERQRQVIEMGYSVKGIQPYSYIMGTHRGMAASEVVEGYFETKEVYVTYKNPPFAKMSEVLAKEGSWWVMHKKKVLARKLEGLWYSEEYPSRDGDGYGRGSIIQAVTDEQWVRIKNTLFHREDVFTARRDGESGVCTIWYTEARTLEIFNEVTSS